MKRMSTLLALSVFALTTTTTTLVAQTEREVTVQLQSPVQVNGATLPAGAYTIHIQNVGGSDTQIVIIQSPKASAMSLASRRTTDHAAAGRTRVVLEVKDGVYHLDKVVVNNNTYQLQ
jgi:hypothetical protein